MSDMRNAADAAPNFPDAVHAYDPAEMGPRRRSALAVLSLVLSVLPVGSLVAPILGTVALVQLRRDPRLDGRALAWAGIVVGVVASSLMVGGAWMQWVSFQRVVEMPRIAIEAAMASDADAMRAQLSKPGSEATSADIQAFGGTLRSSFGTFRGLRVDSRPPAEAGQPRDREVRAPFIATFERGEVPLTVLYESVDGRGFGIGSMLVRRLSFLPAGGPRIVFPDDEPVAPKQEPGAAR
jgi:hypothetical protein